MQFGVGLIGVIYILDELSIGLYLGDYRKFIGLFEEFKDWGNTVVVVEYDEDIMKVLDYLVEMGFGAGEFGG